VKQRHLVVYDYGMGGIWLHINADSPEDIERRWPALQVMTLGDPEWLTPERFAEAERWPGPDMVFDIDRPTGWLADADDDDELRQPNPPREQAHYDEAIAGLQHILLEDSWVLGVFESRSSLTFDLEAALTEAHPEWAPPKSGEQHCYRRISLTFPHVRHIAWLAPASQPATDASGEQDWGHIDTFTIADDSYELTGDWGHVRLTAGAPFVLDR